MRLIAFRPEYQLTVEPARNRIFYKHYAELETASDLPDYLADWTEALDAITPGFTVLSDVTAVAAPSGQLYQLFVEAQQLMLSRGVRLVAEVYSADAATQETSHLSQDESALPVRTFNDLWEADHYLDEIVAAEEAA